MPRTIPDEKKTVPPVTGTAALAAAMAAPLSVPNAMTCLGRLNEDVA